MFHTLCKTLTIALAVLCVMSAVARAANRTPIRDCSERGKYATRPYYGPSWGGQTSWATGLPAELLISLGSGDAVEGSEEVRAASNILLSVSKKSGLDSGQI